MERLITVKDIRERYGCTGPTARKYLRQMFHYENPLTAPGWALAEWERNRERMPGGIGNRRKAELTERKRTGRVIVPRKRGA